jgi:hypothetical protein
MPVLTHLAAGFAGGLIVLLGALLLRSTGTPDGASARRIDAITARLAEVEGTLAGRGGAPGLAGRLDALGKSIRALEEARTRAAAEMKSLEERIAAGPSATPEMMDRLAKLETALTALSATGSGDANELVRSALARFGNEVGSAKAEAGRLAERLTHLEEMLRNARATVETLKADVDRGLKGAAKSSDLTPLVDRVATLDRELQGFLKTEADRTANTSRVVLSLELANLKRAIERGDGYAGELAAVKKAAGDKLSLTVFERYASEGLPTASDLAKSFRKVANAMLDAEAEPPEGTLFERLMAGAKSIVRIRRTGYAADDSSLEATIARMDAALKENHLAEVLAQGKKLPPKATLVGEDWLKRVEARHQVDRALSDTESALKTSLTAVGPSGVDRKQ